MLRAGYAKVFLPAAAVLHSHDYTVLQQFRRAFDEWRGLLEVYGWRESASPSHLLRDLRGELGRARRHPVAAGAPRFLRSRTLAAVGRHHVLRRTGALLGSRADRLPAATRRWLSLEGRGDFSPLATDAEQTHEPPLPR
jgi:hypothetical protein